MSQSSGQSSASRASRSAELAARDPVLAQLAAAVVSGLPPAGPELHPAPAPSQQDIEQLVERVSKRILRFLQRRGVITLVTAPGDGEVTVVPDETLGEQDPLLAKLLAAATVAAAPAGPVTKRQPIRIVLDPDDRPVGKALLCGQAHAFNLQAATRVAANDNPGRERLCRYILRPPLAIAWGAGRLCRRPAGLRTMREGLETLSGFPC